MERREPGKREREREGERGLCCWKIEAVSTRRGTGDNLGNSKDRWVGARVCLNRDLRNLSLEFPVKD